MPTRVTLRRRLPSFLILPLVPDFWTGAKSSHSLTLVPGRVVEVLLYASEFSMLRLREVMPQLLSDSQKKDPQLSEVSQNCLFHQFEAASFTPSSTIWMRGWDGGAGGGTARARLGTLSVAGSEFTARKQREMILSTPKSPMLLKLRSPTTARDF